MRNSLGSMRTIRKFADRHALVYFGKIHADDEARLVRGLTVSRTQQDNHYCVGTVLGHDLIFLQRSDKLKNSRSRKVESYCWNILALDMNDATRLPHVYLEGKNRHGTAFYEALSMKLRQLVELPVHFMSHYDPLFANRFVCRMSAATSVEFGNIITPDRAAVLSHHFSMFDYEWYEDTLYVYYLSRQPSIEKLDTMLKAGLWLTGELETKLKPVD